MGKGSRDVSRAVAGSPGSATPGLDAAWIGERIAFGRQPDLDQLRAVGFTHVVNLRGEHDERSAAVHAGLEHLWLRWTDTAALQPRLADDLAALLDFIASALARPEARVFIHCASGIERAPLAAYVVLREGGSDDAEARTRLRRLRPGMLPWLLNGNSYAIGSFLHERARARGAAQDAL